MNLEIILNKLFEQINNFNQTKDELQKFVNERSIKNKMDLILLKKLMKET